MRSQSFWAFLSTTSSRITKQRRATPFLPRGKHIFGIVRMGERGQIVIPKKARDIFELHAGSELLVLGDEAQGIALQKVEDAESMLESYGRIVNERRADGPTINS